MSMTQIVFLCKADMPSNKQIEEAVQQLGYNFSLLSEPEKQINEDGLHCSINGHETFFEIYIDTAEKAIADHEADWISQDITKQDMAISFVWGADYAAGASIGLISIALADLANALVYYMDDEMKYTRDMLLADTPQFLDELNKQSNSLSAGRQIVKPADKNEPAGNAWWSRLKNLFK